MFHEIDENKLTGTKRNSGKFRIFRGATIDDMRDFLKPYLKLAPMNIIFVITKTDFEQKPPAND